MSKLSTQLNSSRITRTERVYSRQQAQQQNAEFQALKKQADALRESEFSNITSIEEYSQKYNALSPSLKQFFITPTELQQQQDLQRQETITKIDEKITELQTARTQAYNRWQQNLEWANKYNKPDDDFDETWQEDQAYYDNYIRGLQEGRSKLSGGQNLNYGDILAYGSDLANYYKDKQEARTENRKFEERQLKDIEGKTPFLIQQIENGKVVSEKLAYQDPVTKAFAKTTVPLSTKTDLTWVKVSPDEAYSTWKEERSTKPLYLDVKTSDVKLPYTTRGTINDLQGAELKPIYYEPMQSPDFKVVSTLKKVWDKIPTQYIYLNRPKFSLFGGVNSVISFAKIDENSISVKELKEKGSQYLDDKTLALITDELTKSGISEKLEKKYQAEAQLRFEDQYAKDIIYGRITQEEALKNFEDSKDYKILQQKYAEDIKNERVNYALEKNKLGFTKTGAEVFGLQLAKGGLSLVPTTSKGLVLESALFYTGSKVLKAIPTKAINIATAGYGLYGGYQVFSPNSLPEERFSGLFKVGVAGSILGYQGYKYLTKPTIKTIEIPKAKIDLYTSKYGYDIKGQNLVNYPEQKLSQTAIAGRRTVVSTRWRDLLKLDPIYKGVPYAQQGQTYVLESFGSSYSYKTPSAYQKALKLLEKSGYTESQATSVLRYYQPKVTEVYLDQGILKITEQKAVGVFKYSVRQPVIELDKELGISTRGAKTINYLSKVENKLIGKNLITQQSSGVIYTVGKDSAVSVKGLFIDKTKSIVKASELKKGYDLTKELSGLRQFEKAQYKDLISVSQSDNVLFRLKRNDIARIEANRIYEISNTRLIDKELEEQIKYSLTPANIKKTPLSKTFSAEVSQQKVASVKQIIKKSSASEKAVTSSQLKLSSPTPSVSLKSQIRELTGIKDSVLLGVDSKVSSGLGLSAGILPALKSDQLSKLSPKLSANLSVNELTKTDTALKNAVKQATGQTSATISAQLSTQQLLNISAVTPKFNQPVINMTVPNIPVTAIPFYFPPATSGKARKKKKTKSVQDYLYLPDFTARSLGLEAEQLTEKQAQARLKKIMTGLEIRRGVKVKF